MRVGFDPVALGDYCGNGTYTTELIKALSALNPRDTYIVPTLIGRGAANKKLFDGGHGVNILPILPNPMMLGKPFKKRLVSFSKHIERTYAHPRYELYHCTNPLLCIDTSAATVMTVHDLIPLLDEPSWADSRERYWYREHLASHLKRAAAVICDSDSTKASVLERFPRSESALRVIPLAAGRQFSPRTVERQWLSKYGIDSYMKPFMMSVGVFSERKNVPFFLEAYASLPKSLRDGVDIILTGNRPKNKPYPPILDCIARNNLKKNVYVLPNVPQDDLIAMYSLAHGLVYPSLYEGFGLPVLEAMSCGCPVITSATTSLPEVAGDAALSIDPMDRDSCAKAIERLITDEEERKGLRAAGLSRAKLFSWEGTARMTYEVYRSILDAK